MTRSIVFWLESERGGGSPGDMRNGSIARKLGRLGRRFGSTGTSVTLSSELVAKLLIAAELSIKKKSLNKRKLKIKKKN